MAFNRGYQPNPWASGAPPNQSVMSGLMAGYQQPTGPQNHFAANPGANYNLAANNGIQWNQPGLVPNQAQLRMGQQAGWNQNVIAGNQRLGNQRPQKRNANWNDGGHQQKRLNKGTPNMNNSNNNNRNNQNNVVNKTNQNRMNNSNNANNNNNRVNNNFVRQNNNNNRPNQQNNNRMNNSNNRNQKQNNRQGKHHQNAQRVAQNLPKKEYPVKKAVNTDVKVKNEDFDQIQGQYVPSCFGYICKLCDVFLKDKLARNEHVKIEEHLKKFKVAEEEKKAKKLAKIKAKAEQSAEEKTETEDKTEQAANGNTSATTENGGGDETTVEEVEEEDEEQTDADAVEEDVNEEEDVDEVVADSSEVTEESKNLQQSIQQDLSTESTPQLQKKVNQPKKAFTKSPGGRGGKAGRGANRGGRGGNRNKRNN